MPESSSQLVHVAVGVIENTQNQILISLRPEHVHQGGLWEFPGGKVEKGESVKTALCRELKEELNITVTEAEPLIKIKHDYDDKCVLLDVWRVTEFSGTAIGNEQQPLRWLDKNTLDSTQFPAANKSIITALRLSEKMLITGHFENELNFIELVTKTIDKHNISLIQFRAHQLDDDSYLDYLKVLSKLCQGLRHDKTVTVIANRLPNEKFLPYVQGFHLSAKNTASKKLLALPNNFLLGASCHNEMELTQAMAIGADYVSLSPVKLTQSHSEKITCLGWKQFQSLSEKIPLPVYGLGGLSETDLEYSKKHGAYGVAAISAWWC